MKNIGELMRKAQQVQAQMAALQAKMEHLEFTGESGAGAVQVTMTGKGVATSVKINPSVMDDVETLEDLLMLAINDSKGKSEDFLNTEMEKMQSSLGLPKDFKMPF